MTPEQQKLADACTNLQRLTVLGVIAGKSQRQAYYDAGGKAKTDEAADTSAYEIMSRPEVKAFYDSLMVESVAKAIWTRDDSVQTLVDIANAESELAKDRISAVKELNAMHGWNAPAKIDNTHRVIDSGQNEW